MRKVNPFQTAVDMFRQSADEMGLEVRYPGQDLINRMTTPDMCITFRISLALDNGEVKAFEGFGRLDFVSVVIGMGLHSRGYDETLILRRLPRPIGADNVQAPMASGHIKRPHDHIEDLRA